MGRRGRSNEKAIFEAVSAGAGLFLLLWMFSPEFRQAVKVGLLVMVAVAVVAIVIWLIKRRSTRQTFGSSYGTPSSRSFNPVT